MSNTSNTYRLEVTEEEKVALQILANYMSAALDGSHDPGSSAGILREQWCSLTKKLQEIQPAVVILIP